MSAYVVDHDTIDLLVSGAVFDPSGLVVFHEDSWHRFTVAEAQSLGLILLGANVGSVNYRYHESAPVPPYEFRRVFDLGESVGATWWDVVKSCDCFTYQACESPTWGESLARSVIDELRRDAIHHLMPEEAAWGWTRSTYLDRQRLAVGVTD